MSGCERRIEPGIILIIYTNSQTFIAKDQVQRGGRDDDGDGDEDDDMGDNDD